MTSESF